MMPGGMDPTQLAKMMKQLGIKTQEIPAKRIIIELEESKIIIENPQITKIIAQGQESYQVSGGQTKKEESISSEDLDIVMQQTNCDKDTAKKALQESNGDIAQAIMKIKEEQ